MEQVKQENIKYQQQYYVKKFEIQTKKQMYFDLLAGKYNVKNSSVILNFSILQNPENQDIYDFVKLKSMLWDNLYRCQIKLGNKTIFETDNLSYLQFVDYQINKLQQDEGKIQNDLDFIGQSENLVGQAAAIPINYSVSISFKQMFPFLFNNDYLILSEKLQILLYVNENELNNQAYSYGQNQSIQVEEDIPTVIQWQSIELLMQQYKGDVQLPDNSINVVQEIQYQDSNINIKHNQQQNGRLQKIIVSIKKNNEFMNSYNTFQQYVGAYLKIQLNDQILINQNESRNIIQSFQQYQDQYLGNYPIMILDMSIYNNQDFELLIQQNLIDQDQSIVSVIYIY